MGMDVLRKIGLSEGEIKVYSAILDIGLSAVNRIHERTGIERRNIYDILNKLIERGLITYVTENKKRFFQITHPNKIIGYVEEKKDELEKSKQEIEKEIPSMIERFEFKKQEVGAEIYRGVEGIKAVWEDMLNYRHIYFIGAGGYIASELPYFWKNYRQRRLKAGVVWHTLARIEMKGNVMLKEKNNYAKFLPKEFSGTPHVIFIYGNKVANVLWEKGFFAFVIESKEIAGHYKKYFSYLWDNVAKK
jgi:HTH-type transcriptional regulator, sugar sensing transcriptional regulator